MSETKEPPGWSKPFEPGALRELDQIAPLETVTPEWAWGGSEGAGVKVAVLDSGVNAGHPAIGGRVSGYMAIAEEGGKLTYDGSPHEDVFGHGTACAGIILGLAPKCEIYSVRVLDALLTGRGTVFAAGLRWAIENGMNVVNMSLTTPRKEYFAVLHELADRAYFDNIMLVTSANNSPIESFPAMFSSVIAVASHDVDDPYLFYYNPRPPVEFGAHGVDVKVAWKEGWMTTTGNSFATPHIAGITTKILGKHPGLTGFQMKVILRALSANVGGTARNEG